MDSSDDVLALAVLLEQAYRRALALQDALSSDATASGCTATELIDLLDDARVSLLKVSRPLNGACCGCLRRTVDGCPASFTIAWGH